MRTVANYLIVMFLIMLFIFRIVVFFTAMIGIEFLVQPINMEFEIALILIMLVSIVLISKNKLLGAIILLIASIAYYGPTLLSEITNMSVGLSVDAAMQLTISVICVIIPIVAFFIIAFAKEQEKRPVDKKTDFFYKTDRYDRKYDERADKNNYRIM